jgi:hypothetical protein
MLVSFSVLMRTCVCSFRSTTFPEVQWPSYPEGFQGEHIPVWGPYVAELIEKRADGKI